MHQSHCFLLSVLILTLLSRLSATEIELSPKGPIATLEAARDAARALPKPVRVIVADGVYPVTEPVSFGPEDSGVTWEAAPGATPIFSGGKRISGWEPSEGGIWKAPLPDRNWQFEQLWVDGRRATRARTPNRGFFYLEGAIGPSTFLGLDDNLQFRGFTLAPEQFDLIRSIPEAALADLLITVTHSWTVSQCRVEALNEDVNAVKIKSRSNYAFAGNEYEQPFWLENFREALDLPGEWFLDRAAGEVLYIPRKGEDPSQAEIIAPIAPRFLLIQGAENLTFRGLSFQFAHYAYPEEGLFDRQAATSLGAAIEIEDSRAILIDRCEVAHVGEYGIYFKNGCSDSKVTSSHLHDLGGGGVRIGETDRPQDSRVCRGILVDNCIIQHGGRLHPSACGVALTHTQQCSVTHCDIGDFYYTGVSAGWSWGYGYSLSRETLVENNHIHHLGWAYLSDMGGFYGVGVSPGTVVRGNHIHHVASHRYGGWGLYTDEGSSDVRMENNLVHDTSNGGFHQHYGFYNSIQNNIFAFGQSAQIQRTRNEVRPTFRYEGNIVVWDPESPLLGGGKGTWQLQENPERGTPKDNVTFRRNLYWRSDDKIPEFLTESAYTWKEWRAMGRDRDSLFADPLFENLEKRDFRIRPGSPIEKIGFVPWDLSLAGVRKDDAKWRALAAEGHEYPSWERDAVPWPVPDYQVELQTFERVPLGTIGIRKARYRPPEEQEALGQGFGVSEEAASPIPLPGEKQASSKRSLKAQDKPDLVHSFDPVLDIFSGWKAGRFRVAFDLMAREGADGFFEMRIRGGGFALGPYLRWAGGKLIANNTDSVVLGDFAPEEWIRIEIDATTGAGSYQVTLTREDGTSQTFPDIPCRPEWNEASYLLFAGLGTTDTAYFIDNLRLLPVESTPHVP